MHSLPQISSSGGKIVESVVLGNDAITSAPPIHEEHITSVHSEIMPAERVIKPTVRHSVPAAGQESVVKKSKPALILEQGDDITQLEKQPAYIRKQMKLRNQESSVPVPDPKESSTVRLEESNGRQQLLSDNSYIHQTQD